MKNVKRVYGAERTFGDIIYNPTNKSVFSTLDFGFMGQITINLNQLETGGYNITKSYKDKDGQFKSFSLGKLFPVTSKDGTIVNGLAKGTFGLFRQYDKVAGKDYTQTNDCVILTSHKLKESVKFESGFIKVGFITGVFGVEEKPSTQIVEEIVEITQEETEEDIIPF